VDVLISGEEGSGRRTAARWLAHARHKEPSMQRLVTLSGFGLEADRIGAAFERASAVVISDVDWLSPAAQAELTRQLMHPAPRRPALFATLGDSCVARHGSGRVTARADNVSPESKLHPDLLRRLERVSLRTTPLREARHEIPVLACFLARRFLCDQAEQRAPGPAPEFVDDTALAGLWRQSWEGNVAALDGVLHAALLRVDGALIQVDDVRDAVRDLGIDYVTRLPSRDPRPRDVASAAWTTRTATGRINKTRAALYLGWDPNTLAGRLRDLGIDDLEAAAHILGEGA
jgi:DNA-binding NtrC family response regulator